MFDRLLSLVVTILLLAVRCASASGAEDVKLTDHGTSVVLDNGMVSFGVSKANGDVLWIKYQGKSLLAENGYLDWISNGNNHLDNGTFAVVSDPARSHGDLAEISIAQSGAGQRSPFDVELHFVLRRGDSGCYAFATFAHPANYPAGSIDQARWVLRMDDKVFDFINVDEWRRHTLPPSDTPTKMLGPKESLMFTSGPFAGQITDKYHYFTDAGDHFVHGWSGTQSHLGAWVINASNEDQNGGPTKQHNDAHWGRMLFKILTCGHYGATSVNVAAGQEWSKIYGPWMLYFNSGGTPDHLYKDAVRRVQIEQETWPYPWMTNALFPSKQQRGSVSGRIALNDPGDGNPSMANAWIGLAAAGSDWQKQSNGYQFWVHADADGAFTIPNVRPGNYTLYAFANGVIDEFHHDDIIVEPAKETNAGTLEWTPPHFGKRLWQIGTSDRTAKEFRRGDDYHHWGLWLNYPQDFPERVNFLIGKSNERTDWNYAQVNVQQGGQWNGTTWNVLFDLPEKPPKGTATLRLALAAAHAAKLAIFVNGKHIGSFGASTDNALIRAGVHGQFSIRDLPFDAALLVPGRNTIALQQKAGGNPQKGLMYDAVRLELDDARPFDPGNDTPRQFPSLSTEAKPEASDE